MTVDTSKIDLTNKNQKLFAAIMLAGVIGIIWWALPSILWFLTHLYIAIGLAIPLGLAILNYDAVWSYFKGLSWKMTKNLISGDKLGYMYRYYEYLLSRIDKLAGNIKNVAAIKVEVTRKVGVLKETLEGNKQRHITYSANKAAPTILRSLETKVAIDQKQLDNLLPKVVNIEAQLKALVELHDLWKADAEDLKYTLDSKADEYKMLKEINSATGNASEFLKGNSVEYKMYQESLKQIEESVSQYTANLENFERQARPIIDGLSMDRAVAADAGAKLIEEFKQQTISLKSAE